MNNKTFRLSRTGLISVMLIAALVRFPAAGEKCEESETEGRVQAKVHHSSAGWFWGGVGTGMLTLYLGTPLIMGAAAFTSPQPDSIPQNSDPKCFTEGYSRQARSQNVTSAASGGGVGMAISTAAMLVVLVVFLGKSAGGRPIMVGG